VFEALLLVLYYVYVLVDLLFYFVFEWEVILTTKSKTR
jgi:hypothetical protein